MLTLKEPLQLNTVKPINVHSDILGEKIAANYQLMTVSVSAQDLLHRCSRKFLSGCRMKISLSHKIRAHRKMKLK